MRYLWIGALVVVALFGAGCSGSADKAPTFHFHFPKKTTTTTTTTTSGATTPKKLASGPNDQAACASFANLGSDVGEGHRRIAQAFRRLFRELKVAENATLRRDGHQAARALYLSRIKQFKRNFVGIYVICQEMR
jgi:hypothetical protein